jgi:seryl-tRNA synthetase
MKFKLRGNFTFSNDITNFKEDIESFIFKINETIFKIQNGKKIIIDDFNIKKNVLYFSIFSDSDIRPHSVLLQIKNNFLKDFGKKYHLGIREVKIDDYNIEFNLQQDAKSQIKIPFADVKIKGKKVIINIKEIDEEFIRKNYIDRIINRVREKINNQYYEGKKEFWKLIWTSDEKKPIWNKDPTEEMLKLEWLKQGPTKGKWFYRPQSAAIMRVMEEIAIENVLRPLGFKEIIESHIVPFDIWLKTGHMEGMPGEFYYVSEPITRDTDKWERFIDLVKITKEIPNNEFEKNLAKTKSGICYAQCPMIYWSFKGKTISEESLPICVYDKSAVSNRYESGGRHGIERVDEFHRIEPVYIGTQEQLINLREKLIERYKYVFNEILDLEWRMAWVTPWYMQQAGKTHDKEIQDTGTIDFEAYMPYRGDRNNSEWLEFQNLSILGDKYVKVFNIKAQKSLLWSGCSGIGLERWTTAFLAQKGLNSEYWPDGFKKYLKETPRGIDFL